MRWFSLDASVIDWDETTYLLGARALLEGKSLYVDVWDFKPPGIFWLLAGLESLFDNAIVPLRVLGVLLISLTAFFISRISFSVAPKQPVAGFMAGLFFVSAISFNSFNNGLARGYGLEINTEHFFLLFTCATFYLVARFPKRVAMHGLAGLLLGLGFIIKYFVLVDFVVLCYAITVLGQPAQSI